MIQYSWCVVHYTMPLHNNLLVTIVTARRALIIFMIIIYELMSDQQNGRPYMYTTYLCQLVPCDVFVGRPNTQLQFLMSFPLICTDV